MVKHDLVFLPYSPLLMNHDGVPQCTRPQLNIIKQSSGIITSIIDPR